MRTTTRITLGDVTLVGMAFALIAVFALTDEATATGPAYAFTTPTPTQTPKPCVTDPASPIPTDSCSGTPTPTPGPACPGAPSPPGGTCPPCATFSVAALEGTVGAFSTCFPSPTPWVSPSPCPQVSPTNCDAIPPIAGDVDCNLILNLADVSGLLKDLSGVHTAPCRFSGDARCDGQLNAYDAPLIVAHLAGTSPHVASWCPQLGSPY
jgi:hypothetical protein